MERELTNKAKKEIEKLEKNVDSLEEDRKILVEKYTSESIDLLKREINKCISRNQMKIYNLKEKIEKIRKYGLSTGEKNLLFKQVSDYESKKFVTIRRDKGIGLSTAERIGYFKPINNYIKVFIVSSCSYIFNKNKSYENKKEITNFEVIPKEKYDEIFLKNECIVKYFGISEKIIKIY